LPMQGACQLARVRPDRVSSVRGLRNVSPRTTTQRLSRRIPNRSGSGDRRGGRWPRGYCPHCGVTPHPARGRGLETPRAADRDSAGPAEEGIGPLARGMQSRRANEKGPRHHVRVSSIRSFRHRSRSGGASPRPRANTEWSGLSAWRRLGTCCRGARSRGACCREPRPSQDANSKPPAGAAHPRRPCDYRRAFRASDRERGGLCTRGGCL
jgi:hypothetical protein